MGPGERAARDRAQGLSYTEPATKARATSSGSRDADQELAETNRNARDGGPLRRLQIHGHDRLAGTVDEPAAPPTVDTPSQPDALAPRCGSRHAPTIERRAEGPSHSHRDVLPGDLDVRVGREDEQRGRKGGVGRVELDRETRHFHPRLPGARQREPPGGLSHRGR